MKEYMKRIEKAMALAIDQLDENMDRFAEQFATAVENLNTAIERMRTVNIKLDREEVLKVTGLLTWLCEHPGISPEYKTIRDKMERAVMEHDEKILINKGVIKR